MNVINLIIGFYCADHALLNHTVSNRYHIFQHYDHEQLVIDVSYTNIAPFKPREIVLDKICSELKNENGFETMSMTIITLNGQLLVNFIRQKCYCCSFFKDLVFNGIFPGSPKIISKFV